MINNSPSQVLIELKQENLQLKQLLLSAEKELDSICSKTKADLMKSKNLIDSVAPSLICLYSELAKDKFTQFSPDAKIPYTLSIIESLEALISELSEKILNLRHTNITLKSELSQKSSKNFSLAQKKNFFLTKIEENQQLKTHLLQEISEIHETQYIYKQSLTSLPTISILDIQSP